MTTRTDGFIFAEEVAHEERGAYARRSIVTWPELTLVSEAEEATAVLIDPDYEPLDCKGCEERDEKIGDLENELADETSRWRDRCRQVIEIARRMMDRQYGLAELRTIIEAKDKELTALRSRLATIEKVSRKRKRKS